MQSRSCAWCHEIVLVGCQRCPTCGHQPHRPRSQCDCLLCTRGPLPLTEADLQAALAELNARQGRE